MRSVIVVGVVVFVMSSCGSKAPPPRYPWTELKAPKLPAKVRSLDGANGVVLDWQTDLVQGEWTVSHRDGTSMDVMPCQDPACYKIAPLACTKASSSYEYWCEMKLYYIGKGPKHYQCQVSDDGSENGMATTLFFDCPVAIKFEK